MQVDGRNSEGVRGKRLSLWILGKSSRDLVGKAGENEISKWRAA